MPGQKAAAFAVAVAVTVGALAGGLAPVGASSMPLDYQDGNDSGATFAVTDADLSDDEITEGESVDVTATVENTGDSEGTFEAELQEDGDTVDTKEVTLDPGETDTVSFTRTFDETGEYDIAVSGEDAGELEVEEAASPEFEVEEARLSDDEITEGESVDVTAEVENDGDGDGSFTAELQVDGDTVDTEEVDVDAGETETVTFSRTFDDAGEYDIAVSGEDAGELEVKEPASPEFDVEEASLSDSTIKEGERVDVTAEIENAGDADGTFTAKLQVDGETRDSRDVDVDAGESETVSFTEQFDETGTYDIAVSGESAGILEVEEPIGPRFDVVDASVSDSTILVGESVEVTATVENTGDETGQFTAELQVDGDTVATESVIVVPFNPKTVSFTRTFDDAGEYDIAVSGEDAGELDVEEPATFEVTDADLDESTIVEGESVEVTAEIENVGDREGTYEATLDAEGAPDATRRIELDGGESGEVTFDPTFDDAGEYDVAVDGVDAGTVTVEEPAELNIEDADLEDGTILEGESAEVTAEVENEGDREGEFEIRLEADGDTRVTQTIDLDGGESRTIEFTETFDDAGEYDLAVVGDGEREGAGELDVERPATFETDDADLSSETVLEGESITVTATVENLGDREGEHTIPLEIDGETVDTTDVTLEGGEATTVSFEWTPPGTDDYDVAVDGVDAGTLSVDQPATFEVVDADVDPETVLEGGSVTVTATVENVGDREGTYEATLREDGAAVTSRNVTVAAGGSETVTFERTYDEAGAYDLAVGDADAGTVAVEQPATRRVEVVDGPESPVLEGESVEVTAEVENVGDRAGSFPVVFRVDGRTVENRTVDLSAGERETVTFSRTFEDDGEYDLGVAGESAGTVTVDQPATFEVDVDPLDQRTVLTGQPARVSATIENVGDRAGEFTAAFEVDGEAVTSRTLTVAGGETATVEFVRRFTEPGEYDLAVSGADVGTLNVEPQDGEDGDDGSDGGDATPTGDGGAVTVTPDGEGAGFTVARTATDDRVSVAVEGATEGTTVLLDLGLDGPAAGNESLRIERLAVTLAADRNVFEMRVTQPSASPGDRPPVPVGQPRWYVGAESDLEPDAVGNASVAFRLNEEALPADADRGEVHLYQYDNEDGEWTATRATYDDGTYSAPIDGVGPFAVAVFEPGKVTVTNAELGADWVRTGSRTTAEVVVENPGEVATTRTLAVTVDGEPVATREVRLDPGERAELEVEFPVTEGGSVAVNGTAAGTVETGAEAPDGESGNGGVAGPIDSAVPGFSLRLVALLFAAIAIVGRVVARHD